MSRRALAALLCSVALVVPLLSGSTSTAAAAPAPVARAAQEVPSKRAWIRDVKKKLVYSKNYVNKRTARGGKRLAINLDIDNTALATYYSPGKPVWPVRRLTEYARERGVTLLFNTGRLEERTVGLVEDLEEAGYPVGGLCTREQGEPLALGKERCRREYTEAGWTIILNVGNRPTDFKGDFYERAFRLPNYGDLLG